MGNCQRCGTTSQSFGFSMFNTQWLCNACLIEESVHPDYAKAREEELQQVLKGNLNFVGIGLPEDLSKKYAETTP